VRARRAAQQHCVRATIARSTAHSLLLLLLNTQARDGNGPVAHSAHTCILNWNRQALPLLKQVRC
jgi:hypothetical protein